MEQLLSIAQSRSHNVDMNDMRRLGKLVEETMNARNMAAYELARKIGKYPSWVSRFLSGDVRNLPDVATVRAISEALRLPLPKMLEAAGYLDPVQSPTEGYTVPAGDPRMEILLLLDGASDDEVEGVLRVLRPVLDMVQRSDIQSPKAATQPRSRSTREAS